MQAACGVAQLDRVEEFIAKRKSNFIYLKDKLSDLADVLILPEATKQSDPSWFGFPITLRDTANVRRVDVLNFLDQKKIGTRLLFAGNLTRQPYMIGRDYRLSGDLLNTDVVMNNTFWVGVYPGLSTAHFDYIAEKLHDFLGVF